MDGAQAGSHAATVLILGEGIGGLTSALALQRRGISVRMFERAPEFREVIGSGLVLVGNAGRALAKLGLADALAGITNPLRTSALRTWRGDVLRELPVPELTRRIGVSAVAVHRAELQALLAQAIALGTLRAAAAGDWFGQDAAGVHLRLTTGEVIAGDLLVGADGLHSLVRAQFFGPAQSGYTGYTAWRGVVSIPVDSDKQYRTYETWGNGWRFGFVPLTRGRASWFATAHAPEGAHAPDAGGEKRTVLDLVASSHALAQAIVEATPAEAILRTDLYDRPPLATWSQGRGTLLGDAAHPMTPNLGQGACQAIEDAYVLADSLAGAPTVPTVPTALSAYEARRIKRANAIARRSRQQGWIAQWANPLAMGVRSALMRSIPMSALLRQLEWIAGVQL
jgi:2-polyprenyl-6-methoxyphenol hydroxylase-like FAD-dependent oxidoreductase